MENVSVAAEPRDLAGLEYPDIPVLPGWESLPAAGDRLDVSRQRVYQMALNERQFESLHQIPGKAPENPGERKRPAAYVIATWEVNQFLAKQQAAIAGYGAGDTAAE